MLQRDLVPFNPDDWVVVWSGGVGLSAAVAQRRGCISEQWEGGVDDWMEDDRYHIKTRKVLVDDRAQIIVTPTHRGVAAWGDRQFGTITGRAGLVRSMTFLWRAGTRAQCDQSRALHTPAADGR